jgi:hypothetical protein
MPETRMIVTFLQVEGISQGAIHRKLLSVYLQKAIAQRDNKLKDDESRKHRGRPWTLQTVENRVVIEGKIEESNENS